MELLLGSDAVPDVHRSADFLQGLNAQKCSDQQRSLTNEAFSRMESDGPFSVWDVTPSVTWTPSVQVLRKLIIYHSIRSQAPSETRVLFQVELMHSPASASWRITHAMLHIARDQSTLHVWQAPAPSGEGVRLLLEGIADVSKLQNIPARIVLSGGEDGSEELAVLGNIMLR
ncbi:hypothetical protein [Archangium gephyra]|nr:hypothetical protein [Archangium gephyra]